MILQRHVCIPNFLGYLILAFFWVSVFQSFDFLTIVWMHRMARVLN